MEKSYVLYLLRTGVSQIRILHEGAETFRFYRRNDTWIDGYRHQILLDDMMADAIVYEIHEMGAEVEFDGERFVIDTSGIGNVGMAYLEALSAV